ncbi:hypothetical protein MFLO_06887 [Listeria floridensis FSL S10-1187]|uniref:Uncharacterized protein n=1 Tax=Listeria floridensis FSL S10-1187 TaxID=1265817 RepID=A0ABN0RFT4_9LIST|nr:pectate lyase-like adhesive domain-containing protein [Listeria floridensis]EUJ32427.1 hypothetical protein MFLO_06887 [Listeria floridensis FSL S10-1187]
MCLKKGNLNFYRKKRKAIVIVIMLTLLLSLVPSLQQSKASTIDGAQKSRVITGSIVTVDTYQDFKLAVEDANVKEVNLGSDVHFPINLDAKNEVKLSRSLTINGNGYTLYMYNDSFDGKALDENTINFNNIRIEREPYSFYEGEFTRVSRYGIISEGKNVTINLNNVYCKAIDSFSARYINISGESVFHMPYFPTNNGMDYLDIFPHMYAGHLNIEKKSESGFLFILTKCYIFRFNDRK